MSGERLATARAARPAREGGRVSLAGLMTWVVGAGVAAAVCREARPAAWLTPTIDPGRILGLAAALLAILTGVGLFRQAVARVGRGGGQGGAGDRGAVAWRVVVLGLLAAALVDEARLLGGDGLGDASWDAREVRLRLLPLALTLALAGILAGLTAGRYQRPRRAAALSVVWAAAAGVLIATTQAFVPYLVLLAMDAVRNAMPGPAAAQPLRPGLHGRLLHAGAESAAALACCLALGLLVGREFRRPAPREARAADRGLVALGAATVAAAAGAAWLLAVTIPRLDGWLAEGLRVVVNPRNAGIVVLGFAGLALGPAARVSDPSARPEPAGTAPRPWTTLGRIVGNIALALVVVDFTAARAIDLIVARRITDGGPVDESWRTWVGWVDAAFDWLRSVVPAGRLPPWSLFEAPEWLALALAEAWVGWRVGSFLLASSGGPPAPIDACLSDRPTIARFGIRWAALTVLMVASLPASFVAGLALLHVVIRACAA